MIALKVKNQKDFMARLLASEIFDSFFVEEATIDTFNTFHIDGHVHKDFYKSDADYSDGNEIDDYSKWSSIRPICLELIKGKRTPLGFKFVFQPDNVTKDKIIAEADAGIAPSEVLLGLNIRYANGTIVLTTGTAFKTFTLDKSIEKAWDAFIPSFLSKTGIELVDYD